MKDCHTIKEGTWYLVNDHGIHSVYQSQASHVVRNGCLVPKGEQVMSKVIIDLKRFKALCQEEMKNPKSDDFVDGIIRAMQVAEQYCWHYYGQCEMHVPKQRMEDLEQAEKLLAAVCQHTGYVRYADDIGDTDHQDLNYLEDITGLPEWWDKRRPKSEREKKLEKVQAVVKEWWPDGMAGPQGRMAEEILKALEEG